MSLIHRKSGTRQFLYIKASLVAIVLIEQITRPIEDLKNFICLSEKNWNKKHNNCEGHKSAIGYSRLFALVVGLRFLWTVDSRVLTKRCCPWQAGVVVQQITRPEYLTEAPHWDVDAQVLYFVDIQKQTLLCYNPATRSVTKTYIRNGHLGVAVPVAGKKNTFVGGAGTDFVEITWNPKWNNVKPRIKVLATVDVDRRGTRFNDGKVDPKGRFWGGTMGIEMEPELGSLYKIGSDKVPKRMVVPVSISNGLTWSNDNKTFYYIDSPVRKVWAFDYDNEASEITNQRTVFDFDTYGLPGIPDGMTIDTEGNLWVAIFDGGRVISVNPRTGKLLTAVRIPAKQVTSVAFGGACLDILFVTTARKNLNKKELLFQPQAGSVFAVRGLNAVGTPMRSYVM